MSDLLMPKTLSFILRTDLRFIRSKPILRDINKKKTVPTQSVFFNFLVILIGQVCILSGDDSEFYLTVIKFL